MFPITLVFASALILLQIPLTVMVGLHRVKTNIHFLDGGDVKMMRRMRAHANFTETVPITLIAMALVEAMGAPSQLLWSGAAILVAGRLLHLVTILRYGWAPTRAISMAMTFLAMATFGVWGIARGLMLV